MTAQRRAYPVAQAMVEQLDARGKLKDRDNLPPKLAEKFPITWPAALVGVGALQDAYAEIEQLRELRRIDQGTIERLVTDGIATSLARGIPTDRQRNALAAAAEVLANAAPEPAGRYVMALEGVVGLLEQLYRALPEAQRRDVAAQYHDARQRAYDLLLMDPQRTALRCRYCGRPVAQGPYCSTQCHAEYESFIG